MTISVNPLVAGPNTIGTTQDTSGRNVIDSNSTSVFVNSGYQRSNSGIKTFYIFGSSSTYYSFTSDLIGGSCVSYAVRLVQKAGGALRWIGGSGITGETSADQITRLPGIISSWTVIPDYTILQISGNDITSAETMDVVKSRILAMVKMVLNAGSRPVLLVPNLLAAASGITAAQILRHGVINQYMVNLARFDSRIITADSSRYLGDTTTIAYGPISTYMRADGIHTTASGADQVAYALYDALANEIKGQSYTAAMPGMFYDATDNFYGNLLPNPYLNGSSGTTAGSNIVIGTNIIGNIPTNMVLRHTAGTGVCTITKVARTDGKPGYWTRFTFNLTASENWAFNFLPSVSPGANRTLFGMMETQVDTSGITAGYVYTLSARMRDGAASKTVWEAGTIAQATQAESAEPIHASRPEWRVVNPYTWSAFGSTGSLTLEFIASSTIAGTLVIDVACAGIFNVEEPVV
jgi:lysophospholipase L1-like esterase